MNFGKQNYKTEKLIKLLHALAMLIISYVSWLIKTMALFVCHILRIVKWGNGDSHGAVKKLCNFFLSEF